MCISTRTHVTYDNDKPWFTAKLLLQLVQTCTNTHWKRRSAWQRGIITKSYGISSLLVTQLQCEKIWKTSPITRHIPSTVVNRQLVDNLNEFYCRFVKTSFTPPATPVSPTPARWCASGLQKEQEMEGIRPRRCDNSLSENLCWPAGPHLHTDLQQITGAVRSPLML